MVSGSNIVLKNKWLTLINFILGSEIWIKNSLIKPVESLMFGSSQEDFWLEIVEFYCADWQLKRALQNESFTELILDLIIWSAQLCMDHIMKFTTWHILIFLNKQSLFVVIFVNVVTIWEQTSGLVEKLGTYFAYKMQEHTDMLWAWITMKELNQLKFLKMEKLLLLFEGDKLLKIYKKKFDILSVLLYDFTFLIHLTDSNF